MKKIVLITLSLFLILLVSASLYIYVDYNKALTLPNTNTDNQISFVIKQGETIDQVTINLNNVGLLDTKYNYYFKFYLKQNGLTDKIQVGNFLIPQNLSIKELSTTLQNAGIPQFWVTIPEGVRKDQIADYILKALPDPNVKTFDKTSFLALTENTEFISTLNLPISTTDLEGFLFPDRYLFPSEISSELVIQTMTDNFKSKVPIDLTYEQLIVASYLEREGKSTEDKKIISDIIWKRKNEGWYLGIDTTELYYFRDWQHHITFTELQQDNEYNTYTRTGFTPTPISNPGVDSILASKYPSANEYYYYIHDTNGVPHYSKTLSEHNNNINQYLQ